MAPAIVKAISVGSTAIVEALISSGADINYVTTVRLIRDPQVVTQT